MKEYRCPKCGRLLFKASIAVARIEVKCKCGAMAIVEVPDTRITSVLEWHGGAERRTTPVTSG